MKTIAEIRSDFPILAREVYGKPLVYLDNAATSQKPRVVIETLSRLYREENANIHRGVHHLSERCTELYEQARMKVARMLGVEDRGEIIFTSGATAAINLVARSYGELAFCEGDNIVVSEMEHHSNIVPWQLVCQQRGVEIRVLPFDEEGRLEVERLEGLIDERTRIVAVTQASNVLGTMPDVADVVRKAHAKGVPVMVDGCQGVVHARVDVKALDCDFYAFSSHKLYGPAGVGVLYGKREWLEKMPPFLGGGDMVGRVSFEGTTYAELPLKFEAGTANYIDAIGLAAAIDYLEGLDRTALLKWEAELLTDATERLSRIDGLRIYGTTAEKCSIVSFNVEGVHNYDLGMILDKLGIAVRTGAHCADPVMDHYGVRGMCRASMAFYNTHEEVEALAAGVERAVRMLK